MTNFDAATHTYTNNGKKLISCTELLHKHHLAPDYSNVNKEMLEKSATRGTLIHNEIHEYLTTKQEGFSLELNNFKKYFNSKKLTCLGTEEIVSNDIVAGTYDFLYQDKKGLIHRVDFKTTYNIQTDYVSWQLSIYDYLDTKYKADVIEVWHFDPSTSELKVKKLIRKLDKDIEKLMDCERNGTIYGENRLPLPIEKQEMIVELQQGLESAKLVYEELEKKLDSFKEEILQLMEQNHWLSCEIGNVRVNYIAENERVSINSAKLKAEQPEIYEQYKKTSKQKSYVRLSTIKEK